jgi:hypothetical protein
MIDHTIVLDIDDYEYYGIRDSNFDKSKLEKLRDTVYSELADMYSTLIDHKVLHKSFRWYPDWFKNELKSDAYCRGMGTGVMENNKNYGIPYFLRFDIEKSEEPFSWWTKQVTNFFIQYIKDEYTEGNIKRANFDSMQIQYNQKWARHGLQFNIGAVIDKEN